MQSQTLTSLLRFAATLLIVVSIAGCQSSTTYEEVIDLNKVLAVFDETVKQQEIEAADDKGDQALAPAKQENAEDTKKFLIAFADGLNKANLYSKHLGAHMIESGTIEGFVDSDKNRKKLPTEKLLFSIAFDAEGNRVIATQVVEGKKYYRDHHYSSGYGRYYYYRSLHSSMWRRQNRYYGSNGVRGTSGKSKPSYDKMKMSPSTYHQTAVSSSKAAANTRARAARASRSSARSYGGSRSFSSGK